MPACATRWSPDAVRLARAGLRGEANGLRAACARPPCAVKRAPRPACGPAAMRRRRRAGGFAEDARHERRKGLRGQHAARPAWLGDSPRTIATKKKKRRGVLLWVPTCCLFDEMSRQVMLHRNRSCYCFYLMDFDYSCSTVRVLQRMQKLCQLVLVLMNN